MKITYIGDKSLKLKCDDTELENLVREVVSDYKSFVSIINIESNLMLAFEHRKLFEKEANTTYSSIKLTLYDQIRINKILSQMIMSGQLIINLIGPKYYSGNGIEVAWTGE